MLLNDGAKRLLIFMFYDKDGMVDRYIPYMLKDMKKNVSEIIFVSNGDISEESKPIVREITPNIIERENTGLDVAAYIAAMESIGWEKLKQYDELILMNNTIMGPIYPFKEMFDIMRKKDIDFWGIAKHSTAPNAIRDLVDDGYIPTHIQAYFLVVRNSILSSDEFKKYWNSLPEINSYKERIAYHEIQFTAHFNKLNFSWDVYINTDDLDNYHPDPLMINPIKLIRDRRCPIFKKRCFFYNYDNIITDTLGEHPRELIEYLHNETNYDINLIWENILRCHNMADIKNCLHLNYVLPTSATSLSDNILKSKKIALIFHAHYADLANKTIQYINMMPSESDIYITTNTSEKKELFEKLLQNHKFRKLEVMLIKNRGRDVSALLVASKSFIMDYDYVCFAHDKKSPQSDHLIIGESYAYQCLENILGSEDYVKNIIELFQKNPKLGIIMPPPPNHGEYISVLCSEWGINFPLVEFLCEKLELNVSINENKNPVATLGSFFWFRPCGMKKLFDCDWQYTDFNKEPLAIDGTISHAIERIYSLVEQDAGFYAAWCMTDRFAPIMITNLNYMLTGIFQKLDKKYLVDYQTTKSAVKYQSHMAMELKNINANIFEIFNNVEKKLLHTPMTLFYDIGKGFDEKRAIKHKIDRKSSNFNLFFSVSNVNSHIKKFRFDPEENSNICLKNLKITLCFEDNSKENIKSSTIKTNGLYYKNKFIFTSKDPWLIFNVSSPKKLKKVNISSKIYRDYKLSTAKNIICKFLMLLKIYKRIYK